MVDTPVFFYCAVYNKSKLFVPFRQCALLIIGKSGDCLCYANIVSKVGSCGYGLKKTQNQTRQGTLLKVVKVEEFSSSI